MVNMRHTSIQIIDTLRGTGNGMKLQTSTKTNREPIILCPTKGERGIMPAILAAYSIFNIYSIFLSFRAENSKNGIMLQ